MNILEALEQYLKLCEEAENTPVPKLDFKPKNVVICGMGGSGLVGKTAKRILENSYDKPIVLVNSYDLPAFADQNTLVICVSYSGNTEETVSAFKQALDKKCKVVTISSGGTLSLESPENIAVKPGLQPRAALPLMLIPLLKMLGHEERVDFEALKKARDGAKEISRKLLGKNVIIYSSGYLSSVATGFKSQLNENAKSQAKDEELPEMNHNEISAWETPNPNSQVVFVTGNESERMKQRFQKTKEFLERVGQEIIEIRAIGGNQLTKALFVNLKGGWISHELANLKGIDSTEIKLIKELKDSLKKA